MGRRRRKGSGEEPRIDIAARLAPYVGVPADDQDESAAPESAAPEPPAGVADEDAVRSGVTPGQSR